MKGFTLQSHNQITASQLIALYIGCRGTLILVENIRVSAETVSSDKHRGLQGHEMLRVRMEHPP